MHRCLTLARQTAVLLALALFLAVPAALASDPADASSGDAGTPASIQSGCMMTLESSAYCGCLADALPDTWEYRYYAELMLMSERRASKLDETRSADRERSQAARKGCMAKTGLED